MNTTIFTVKCTKGNGESHTIRLGVGILDGMGDDAIRIKAEQSMIIDMQGKLRKCADHDAVVAKLNDMNFVNATVSPYVKEASDSAKLKALLAKGYTVADIEAAIEATQ